MRVLELFSGTRSVGNVCKAHGIDVVSMDRDMPADIRSDIMDWHYTTYKPDGLRRYMGLSDLHRV